LGIEGVLKVRIVVSDARRAQSFTVHVDIWFLADQFEGVAKADPFDDKAVGRCSETNQILSQVLKPKTVLITLAQKAFLIVLVGADHTRSPPLCQLLCELRLA